MGSLSRAWLTLLALAWVSTAWVQAAPASQVDRILQAQSNSQPEGAAETERSSEAKPAGQAARLSEADAQAIRSVIEAQLAAFAADDAGKAFSFATSGIQGTFATPENFIAMVKNTYPVVYRPAAVTFLEAEAVGEETLQRVQMSDDSSGLWIALYRMQRQPDGTWLIDGCVLAAVRGSRA